MRRCQRGAHWSTSDGGKEWWRLELVARSNEGTRDLEREGKRGGEGLDGGSS
jgi:hypothetical protein